jgi:hypothetical protein
MSLVLTVAFVLRPRFVKEDFGRASCSAGLAGMVSPCRCLSPFFLSRTDGW